MPPMGRGETAVLATRGAPGPQRRLARRASASTRLVTLHAIARRLLYTGETGFTTIPEMSQPNRVRGQDAS